MLLQPWLPENDWALICVRDEKLYAFLVETAGSHEDWWSTMRDNTGSDETSVDGVKLGREPELNERNLEVGSCLVVHEISR